MKALEIIINIILNIITVILVALVILVMYNFIEINVLERNYTNIFGYSVFQIETGSMTGTLEIDDVILVKITQDVEVNDIITFEDDGDVITHRVIEKDEDKLITKGDANNAEDKQIEKNQIIGKVVKTIPRLGIWIKVLSDVKVIVSIAITVIFLGLATKKEDKE